MTDLMLIFISGEDTELVDGFIKTIPNSDIMELMKLHILKQNFPSILSRLPEENRIFERIKDYPLGMEYIEEIVRMLEEERYGIIREIIYIRIVPIEKTHQEENCQKILREVSENLAILSEIYPDKANWGLAAWVRYSNEKPLCRLSLWDKKMNKSTMVI